LGWATFWAIFFPKTHLATLPFGRGCTPTIPATRKTMNTSKHLRGRHSRDIYRTFSATLKDDFISAHNFNF
jgi:hypothetical protein